MRTRVCQEIELCRPRVLKTRIFENSHFPKAPVFTYSSSKLEKSAWIGPIQSDYGWHLVLITQISDSYTPMLNSVEADVRGDLYREEQFASKMRRLNQVKAKYELIDQTDSYD